MFISESLPSTNLENIFPTHVYFNFSVGMCVCVCVIKLLHDEQNPDLNIQAGMKGVYQPLSSCGYPMLAYHANPHVGAVFGAIRWLSSVHWRCSWSEVQTLRTRRGIRGVPRAVGICSPDCILLSGGEQRTNNIQTQPAPPEFFLSSATRLRPAFSAT